jgi:hypothetical protein
MITYWLIAVGVLLYFTVPVILVHRLQHFNWDLNAVPMEPDRALPKVVDRYLTSCREELGELGFTALGPIVLPNTAPNVAAIIEMFVNRTNRDMAMVSCVYGLSEGSIVQSVRYVEFIRRFRGGNVTLVQTNNLGRPGSFRGVPQELCYRFSTIRKIDKLYQVHLKLIKRDACGLKPYLRLDEEFGGDAIRYLEAILRESFQRQTDKGWLYYEADNKRWRPTVWGAINLTWQELAPFKQLRTMRLQGKGRRELARLQRDDEF